MWGFESPLGHQHIVSRCLGQFQKPFKTRYSRVFLCPVVSGHLSKFIETRRIAVGRLGGRRRRWALRRNHPPNAPQRSAGTAAVSRIGNRVRCVPESEMLFYHCAMTDIKYLYKYGRLTKHSKALFTTAKIYLSVADKLNDPFECRPQYTFEGDEREVISSYARGFIGRNPLASEQQAVAAATKLYKEGKHEDPEMLSQLRNDFTDMCTRRVGIYCLSEVPDSILMWSHYASSHTGYCIEFKASDTTPCFGEAQQVNYSETYPLVAHFRMPGEKKMDLTFLTKFAGWKYEREWRIIEAIHGPGHYAYPPRIDEACDFQARRPSDAQGENKAMDETPGSRGSFRPSNQKRAEFRHRY